MTYAVGVDFGTTNSVVAFANEKGEVRSVTWPTAQNGAAGATQTFRTALMFWKQGGDSATSPGRRRWSGRLKRNPTNASSSLSRPSCQPRLFR